MMIGCANLDNPLSDQPGPLYFRVLCRNHGIAESVNCRVVDLPMALLEPGIGGKFQACVCHYGDHDFKFLMPTKEECRGI